MGAAAEKGCYVYGIVPEDVELDPGARGAGDPPGRIRLVRYGEIAALVSDIEAGQPPRRPGDLRAHRDLLDATAAEVPVLPVPFGRVLADRDALIGQLLGPHHDEFASALQELDGHVEYVIEARYDAPEDEEMLPRDALSNEIAEAVNDCCAAVRVRDRTGSAAPDGSTADATEDAEATDDAAAAVGAETLEDAADAEDTADADEVDADEVDADEADADEADAADDTDDPEDIGDADDAEDIGDADDADDAERSGGANAAEVAVLIETARLPDLEQVVDDLARDWDGVASLWLSGPVAAYDFVAALTPPD